MKSLIFALVAIAALAVVPQAEAHHGLAVRQAVVVRRPFVRQRVVVAPFRQQVVVGHHAQAFVAPVYQQQFVAPVIAQPVYGVQQFVAPVQAGHCQQFFTR